MINHSDTWNNGSPSIPQPRSRCSHDRHSKRQDAVTIKSKRAWERRTLHAMLHATCYIDLEIPHHTINLIIEWGPQKKYCNPTITHQIHSLIHPSPSIHPLLGMRDPEHLVQLPFFPDTDLLGAWAPFARTLSVTPLRKKDGKEQKRGERKGREGRTKEIHCKRTVHQVESFGWIVRQMLTNIQYPHGILRAPESKHTKARPIDR